MAGNVRFESPSANSSDPGFAGPYPNGHRGIHSVAVGSNLDRPGCFIEGAAVVAAENLPQLSQCLSLEPIVMGGQKIIGPGELKRAMELPAESTTEENSSGAASAAAHLRSSPPAAAVDDLKQFRSSIEDTCVKARGRATKLEEHLHKLDKFCQVVTSKKQQMNQMVTDDTGGASNMKTGAQFHKNPSELAIKRVDDRPKNVLLNKRVRTSVAETRAACRRNGLQRQPVAMSESRESLNDDGGESDSIDEKIHRLPAEGEGWDKKMKRKRSVGMAFTKPIDNDGEPRKAVQNKAVSEPDSKPNISHTHRLNNHGDRYTTRASPATKEKASKSPQTGSILAANSPPSILLVSGILESSETATGANKIPSTGGASNHKRVMPSGSPSPPIAQSVDQRPQKISRTTRADMVSPVSNQDEKQISSGSCSPSNIGVTLASTATNGSLVSRNAANGSHPFKVKIENFHSPLRLSENEEPIDGEGRLKHKGTESTDTAAIGVQNVGPTVPLAKKNKPPITKESGDGVRVQGRSGRGPLMARASISPTGEKLDKVATPKPCRSKKPGCEKNGSKSGRPLKRLSDQVGVSRLGNSQNGGSPNCRGRSGKSDDDREELLAAANHARNASYLACSSGFWEKMEPLFAPVGSEDKDYLYQQLKSEQQIQESFPQLLGRQNNAVMGILHQSTSVYDTITSGERNGQVQYQKTVCFSGRPPVLDRTSTEFIPLYQRVLSALIIEDNIDELEEGTGNPLQDTYDDSFHETFPTNNSKPRKRARREIDSGETIGINAQSPCSVKKSFSSNGGTDSSRSPSINNSPCEDVHSEVVMLTGVTKNFTEGFGISSVGCQYEQMRLDDKLLLELQSIGLYPEMVPDLDDKEDEVIKQKIDQLKIKLQQQIAKKKEYLAKICRGVGSSSGGRYLEGVAIDRLVEQAYRKFLATKRNPKAGTLKIPKQVAMAFGRRTLTKCRKFANSGRNCFSEPPLRDILYAPCTAASRPSAGTFRRPSEMLGTFNHLGKKKELSQRQNGARQPTRSLPFSRNESRQDMCEKIKDDVDLKSTRFHDFVSIDEIGISGGGEEDLSSLLNFDEEDLQDHFSAGLDIPMDDLSELNMF